MKGKKKKDDFYQRLTKGGSLSPKSLTIDISWKMKKFRVFWNVFACFFKWNGKKSNFLSILGFFLLPLPFAFDTLVFQILKFPVFNGKKKNICFVFVTNFDKNSIKIILTSNYSSIPIPWRKSTSEMKKWKARKFPYS